MSSSIGSAIELIFEHEVHSSYVIFIYNNSTADIHKQICFPLRHFRENEKYIFLLLLYVAFITTESFGNPKI